MFDKLGVLSEVESHSRYHIKLEKYAKDIDIEAKMMVEMVNTLYVPAGVTYLDELSRTIKRTTEILGKEPSLKTQVELLRSVSIQIDAARRGAESLTKALAAADKIEDVEEKALALCHKVKPLFTPLREAVDTLEGLVPANLWPVPKYREMLFLL
jgi:glutamine synthetase